ncbi:GNAT superfamily N-acetyltransferase [Actinoplanes octamycinicus]|uniref:GNAT superfamily N-acetyltransferase n=1 Tax=Actinoplanes octamycinicus TaxID=135948 RepID=A0A7W7M9J1_9ACTN|nr:GNAT family N-acetyltransferase [Actinoplanes octamycinicus]MBB4741977.1 GNAT superfamily N-acetyltransferase [Actinoplanes octamycinicus]
MEIRLLRSEDSTAVSEIIRRCLREINSRDYPEEIIGRMCEYFSPERIMQLAEARQMFVAVDDGTVVGTVSRDGNKVFTMFVQPQGISRGVGRRLMGHIETLAANEGYEYMETGASITAHGFYQRLGYLDVRTSETEFGFNYILRKTLRSRPTVS